MPSNQQSTKKSQKRWDKSGEKYPHPFYGYEGHENEFSPYLYSSFEGNLLI